MFRSKQKIELELRHLWVVTCVIIVLAALMSISATIRAQTSYADRLPTTQDTDTTPVPDVVLVKVKRAESTAVQTNQDSSSTGVEQIDQKFDNKNKDITTDTIVTPSAKTDLNSDLARWVKIKVDNPGTAKKDAEGNTYYPDVDKIITQLKADPTVEAVQKDETATVALNPDDPFFFTDGGYQVGGDMWGLQAIHAPQAWDTTTGSSAVTVGVLDTGIDFSHPDLAANAWVNPGEIAGNGIDDDGNGYIDDINGWNFRNNNNQVTDVLGHGTHVAGTIAAVGNNTACITGISWHSKVLAARICDADNKCYFSSAASATQYASDMGVKVTNNSYGGSNALSPILTDAIRYAHDHNVTSVVAAMNNNADLFTDLGYPALDDNVITVGSITPSLARSSFSNYGARLDVMAPGSNILSVKAGVWTYGSGLCPVGFGGNYCFLSGTSMATPHVTGVVALMLSRNANLTPEQIRQILRNTATDLGTPGFDEQFGYGLVQADSSVSASSNPTVLAPYISSVRYASNWYGLVPVTGTVIGPNLANYTVEIGAGYKPSSWTQIGGGTTNVNTVQTLASINSYNYPNNTPYSLRLTATDTQNKQYTFSVNGFMFNSFPDSTPPSVPTNLSATPSANQVSLNWTASTDDIAGVLNYTVKRNGTTVGAPTNNNFVDTGLAPNTQYTYTVSATDLAGNTSGTVSTTVTTLTDGAPPTQVTNFVAQTRAKRSITLAWTASTDDVAVTGYRIYRGGVLLGTTAQTNWQDSGLTINTAYSYTIEAFDAVGNVSPQTSLNTSTLADTTAPSVSFSAPTGGATARRNIDATVNATDDESIAKVEIYRDADLIATLTSAPYTASINVIALTNGSHTLRAVATDTANNTSETTVSINVSNPVRGDLNNDNNVNIFDLSILLANWNQTSALVDLDGNTFVNIFDLSIMLSQYH